MNHPSTVRIGDGIVYGKVSLLKHRKFASQRHVSRFLVDDKQAWHAYVCEYGYPETIVADDLRMWLAQHLRVMPPLHEISVRYVDDNVPLYVRTYLAEWRENRGKS